MRLKKNQIAENLIFLYLLVSFILFWFKLNVTDPENVEIFDFAWIGLTFIILISLIFSNFYSKIKTFEFIERSKIWKFSLALVIVSITTPDIAFRSLGYRLPYELDSNYILIFLFSIIIWEFISKSEINSVWTKLFFWISIIPISFAWMQTTRSIIDKFHFSFTSDEILALASGKTPFIDYFPQYSSILGFPLLAVHNLVEKNVVFFSVSLLVVYQFLTISLSIFALNSISRTPLKYLMFAGVCASPFIVKLPNMTEGFESQATAEPFLSPSSYFATFPIRVFLPTLIFFYVVQIYRKVNFGKLYGELKISKIQLITLGSLSGLTFVNNFDFGLPALIAVSITFLVVNMVLNKPKVAFKNFLQFLAAQFSIILIFFIGLNTFIGPLNLEASLGFLRGLKGNFVAIPAVGIHIAYVILAFLLLVISLILIRSEKSESFPLGVASLYWSMFCIFSLPYFGGRSLYPSFIAGYVFNFAILLALLFIWISDFNLHSRSLTILTVAVISVSFAITLILHVPRVSSSIIRITSQEDSSYLQYANINDKLHDLEQIDKESVSGIVSRNGNIISILGNLKNIGVANDPLIYEANSAIAKAQCKEIISKLNFGPILLGRDDESLLAKLEATENCQGALQISNEKNTKHWLYIEQKNKPS